MMTPERYFALIIVTLFACGATALAQHAMDITAIRTRDGRPPIASDQFQPLHASHHFQSTAFCEQLVENTRSQQPGVYSKMLDTASRAQQRRLVLGERASFFVTNFHLHTYEQITGELRASTRTVNVYVDVNELSAGHISDSFVDSLVLFLAQQPLSGAGDPILPFLDSRFGTPPYKDGDSTLDVLIYDVQDGFNGSNGFISGYFSKRDQTNSVESNRRDILYLDAWPTIYPPRGINIWLALETLTHEYQHLIHYHYDSDEATFIDEACSMEAENLCGFTRHDVMDFFHEPNVSLLSWDTTRVDPLPDLTRAQYFAFYLERHFSPSFMRELVKDTLHGLEGLTSALRRVGASASAEDIFEWWSLANHVQNRTLDPRYSYLGAALSDDGSEKKPAPAHRFFTDTVPLTRDTVQPLAAIYLSIRNAGYFEALFRAQPTMHIYAVTPTSVDRVLPDTPFLIKGIYPEVVFVCVNMHPDSEAVIEYSTVGRSAQREIFYDNGVPDTLSVDGKKYTYLTVGNSVAAGGAGYALAFLPPENSTLVSARYYLAFDQELPGSTTPASAPRTFAAHVWKKDKGKPGENLIEIVRYTIDRALNPAGTFIDVSLTPWSQFLNNLTDTVFVGYTDDDPFATAIGLTKLAGPASHSFLYTGIAWTESGGIKRNRWYSFNDLSFGQSQVSLSTYEIMIRTVWLQSLLHAPNDPEQRSFTLHSAYPNPLLSHTTIKFSLRTQTTVVLRVTDLLGREVARLIDDKLSPGLFTTQWDARSDNGSPLPNGIYFCTLQTSHGTQTQKLILAR